MHEIILPIPGRIVPSSFLLGIIVDATRQMNIEVAEKLRNNQFFSWMD